MAPALIDRLGTAEHGVIGLVFQVGSGAAIAMVPDSDFDSATILYPTAQQMIDILNRADEPMPLKAFIRKSQRISFNRLKQDVWRRDNYHCVYCEREMGDVTMTIDHFIPVSAGGRTEYSNLVSCCLHCNRDKADSLPETWCRPEVMDRIKAVLKHG